MPLLVCYACGRQRVVFCAMSDKRICSNCRARHPILVRNQRAIGKRSNWIEWVDKDGIPAQDAYETVYAQLMWIGEHRHYKPAWQDMKFLKIFGWTDGLALVIHPEPPTAALLYWVHRDNLEWRRHKEADEIAGKDYANRVDERITDLLPSFMTPDDWGVKL